VPGLFHYCGGSKIKANSREMCDSEPEDMSPSPAPEGAHHNQRQTTYDKCYIRGVEQSYEISKWYVTIHRFLANVLHCMNGMI
jgi:hypothetical protein